jgi:hypothetical protein
VTRRASPREKLVVITASFSGNAFSVTIALGILRSPSGQPRSVQNPRMCAMTLARAE